MIYYMSFFAPEVAEEQWALFQKAHEERPANCECFLGISEDFQGWMADSGPILAGMGVAASGPFPLKTAAAMNESVQKVNEISGASNRNLSASRQGTSAKPALLAQIYCLLQLGSLLLQI